MFINMNIWKEYASALDVFVVSKKLWCIWAGVWILNKYFYSYKVYQCIVECSNVQGKPTRKQTERKKNNFSQLKYSSHSHNDTALSDVIRKFLNAIYLATTIDFFAYNVMAAILWSRLLYLPSKRFKLVAIEFVCLLKHVAVLSKLAYTWCLLLCVRNKWTKRIIYSICIQLWHVLRLQLSLLVCYLRQHFLLFVRWIFICVQVKVYAFYMFFFCYLQYSTLVLFTFDAHITWYI